MRLNMEISKTAVLLANKHHSKEMLQTLFVYIFTMSFTQKRLCQLNARECCIKEDFNQNGSLIISLNIE